MQSRDKRTSEKEVKLNEVMKSPKVNKSGKGKKNKVEGADGVSSPRTEERKAKSQESKKNPETQKPEDKTIERKNSGHSLNIKLNQRINQEKNKEIGK